MKSSVPRKRCDRLNDITLRSRHAFHVGVILHSALLCAQPFAVVDLFDAATL